MSVYMNKINNVKGSMETVRIFMIALRKLNELDYTRNYRSKIHTKGFSERIVCIREYL